ncbi:MAG: ABC transporter substrate-binding protein [Chloroflexota bacterium]|nr:MAG: ABC transporter substrate-binding protein [Chloroflexota bacterium]
MSGRRKGLFLAPILVAILLVGSLGGGCTSNTPAPSGKPTTSTSAPATGAQQPTGELKIAMNTLQKQMMDPTLDSGSSKQQLVPMFDYLVGIDAAGNLSKDYGIAKDWKVEHTATNSVYTFTIRQGVKFHDGTEVTANDVKFSIEYFKRPESISSYAAALRVLIDRIEVFSQYQVVVYTKKPHAFLLTDLSELSSPDGYVLPKDYIEKNGTDYFNKHPIGTGPYKFKENLLGTRITYEAVDYQHWLQRPKYKTVTLMLVPEESTRIAMLKAGEADVLDSVSRSNVASLQAAGKGVFSWQGNKSLHLWLTQTWEKGTYLNDIRVREALNLSVDRQPILNNILKGAGRISGAGPYGSWAYGYQPVPLYDYDTAKAKALLEQAIKDNGWNRVELTVYSYPWFGVPEAEMIVEAIAGMWTQAFGNLIKLDIVPIDWVAYRQKLMDKKASNSVSFMGSPNISFWIQQWQNVWHSKGTYYLATTPQLDALIDKAAAEPDMAKVGQEQFDVAKYMRDNHFLVPIAEANVVFAANPQKVTQWDLGKFQYNPNYRDIMVQGRAYPAK